MARNSETGSGPIAPAARRGAEHSGRRGGRPGGLSRRTLLAGTALLLPGVTACGALGGGDAPGTSASAPAKKAVNLHYMTFWDQARLSVIAPAMKEFEQRTGHTVNMESVPGYTDKFVVLFASGAAPDVPHAVNFLMPKLFDQGAITDLMPYVNREKMDIKRDYGLMGLEYWGGKIHVMPYVLSPHAWYYNKTLLKEVGAPDPWDTLKGDLTWDDMLTIAKAATRPAQGEKPERFGVKLTYNDIEYQLGGFTWSNGGRSHDWSTLKYTMDQPPAIAAVQWVHDLLHKHQAMMSTATANALRDAGVANPFLAGRVALIEDSTGQLSPLLTGVKDQFEWDVFPIPRARRGGPPPVTYTSGDPNCINATSDKQDAAWQLVQWLAGPQVQHLIGSTKLLTPALNEASSDTKGFGAPPPAHIKVFSDVFKGKVFRRFLHYNHQQGLATFRKWLDQAFDANTISVEQALREATREANLLVEVGKTRPTFPD
jgi:multiple sugar transport system substrate-binding protein